MRSLKLLWALYCRHPLILILGITLSVITLSANLLLLSLSSWLLAASAIAGLSGTAFTFNYLLPACGIRFLALLRIAGRYFERLINHDATLRVLSQLRIHTFRHLLPLSTGSLSQLRQGDLLQRLVTDIEVLDHIYLRLLCPLVSLGIVLIATMLLLHALQSQLGMVVGTLLLFFCFTTPLLFYRTGETIGKQITTLQSQYRLLLVEWLQRQAELLLFGAAMRLRHTLEQTEHTWQMQQQRYATLNGLAQALTTCWSTFMLVVTLWFCAVHISSIQPEDNMAWIASVAFLILALFEALAPLATAFHPLSQVVASAQRVEQLFMLPAATHFPTQGPLVPGSLPLTLDNITFSYPHRYQPALKGITFSLEAGKKIAVLGHTGCGKSTLLHLLTRAFPPSEGTIQIAQQVISAYTEPDLRRMMSVLTQRTTILSATLEENLRLADPEADNAALLRVLQQVGLHQLLTPHGLSLWLGSGGRPLSGGEQRRLAVARILLRSSPLLLLDEPTEGLDPENEQRVFNVLLAHARHKTMILVTHRPYGLQQMDSIAFMESGCIVEYGTHAALMELQGYYYRFQQRYAWDPLAG